MSLRLERAIDEVNRIERKIMMYQNQKKEAMARLKIVENEEIIKSIRALNLDRDGLVELLKGLQEGTVTFSGKKDEKNALQKQEKASSGQYEEKPSFERNEEEAPPDQKRDSIQNEET